MEKENTIKEKILLLEQGSVSEQIFSFAQLNPWVFILSLIAIIPSYLISKYIFEIISDLKKNGFFRFKDKLTVGINKEILKPIHPILMKIFILISTFILTLISVVVTSEYSKEKIYLKHKGEVFESFEEKSLDISGYFELEEIDVETYENDYLEKMLDESLKFVNLTFAANFEDVEEDVISNEFFQNENLYEYTINQEGELEHPGYITDSRIVKIIIVNENDPNINKYKYRVVDEIFEKIYGIGKNVLETVYMTQEVYEKLKIGESYFPE